VSWSSFTFVLVIDFDQVPPSCALAFAWSCSICEFWCSLLLDDTLPSTAAALPAPPMLEEEPVGLLDVPPVPSVEAEVPPAERSPPCRLCRCFLKPLHCRRSTRWAIARMSQNLEAVLLQPIKQMLSCQFSLFAIDRAVPVRVGDDG